MAGHTLLIVGAGFSKPFGGPLMPELLSPAFTANSPADPAALRALAALADERDYDGTPAGEEAAFTQLWETQFTGGRVSVDGATWLARDLIRELRLHLTFIASCVHLDFRRPFSHQLEMFMKGLVKSSRTLSVISFNYDTLVEDCLDHAGLLYSYGDRRTLSFVEKTKEKALDKFVPDVEILKLHGSANWGICRDCTKAPVGADLINAFQGIYGLGRNKSCQFCGKEYLQLSLVPPVENKGAGLQSMEVFWTRARRAAERAREVLAIGYSLPAEDWQAIDLLRTINGPAKRPRIRVVCGSGGTARRYQSILKKVTDLNCKTEDFLSNKKLW